MIFVIRVIIFSTLIIIGFVASLKKKAFCKIITFIYIYELLWYTLLGRFPLFAADPITDNDSILSISVISSNPSIWGKVGKLVNSIFGVQPDGTLAGGGTGKAMIFNAMLFVPMGYLLLLLFQHLRKSNAGRICAILISAMVSVMIEVIQGITGLGMTDIKDVIGNVLGAAVGVAMVMLYDRYSFLRR